MGPQGVPQFWRRRGPTAAMLERWWPGYIEGERAWTYYWGSADFCSLVQDAMREIDPNDWLDADVPCDQGVIYLSKEVRIDDLPPAPSDDATHLLVEHVCWWRTPGDDRVYFCMGTELRLTLGAGAITATLARRRGEEQVATSQSQRLAAAAMWLLSNPGVTETERFNPYAHQTRRQQQRSRKKKPVEPVVVINLRRSVSRGLRDVAEAERRHEHRWIVRGHWRNQPCGPRRSERRRTYIAPHVKGPDGAPMLKRDKVYRW